MDCFPSNRDWMYHRNYSGRGALKESFVKRVEEFVNKTHQQDCYNSDGGIRCPCVKCDFTKILRDEIVKVHLYKVGFIPNYWIWTYHGEETLHVDDNCMGTSSSVVNVDKVFQQTHKRKDIGQFIADTWKILRPDFLKLLQRLHLASVAGRSRHQQDDHHHSTSNNNMTLQSSQIIKSYISRTNQY